MPLNLHPSRWPRIIALILVATVLPSGVAIATVANASVSTPSTCLPDHLFTVGPDIKLRKDCGQTLLTLTENKSGSGQKDSDAVLSTDGTTAMFTRKKVGGLADVYVMAAKEGETPKPLQGAPGTRSHPSWPTTIGKIAYEDTGEIPGVYLSKPDGTEAKLLIKNGKRPAFSPNGQMVSATVDNQIWIARTDGTGKPYQRTHDRCINDNSDWSPDSELVFYDSTGDDCPAAAGQISVVPADPQSSGAYPRVLTSAKNIKGIKSMPTVANDWTLAFVNRDPNTDEQQVLFQPLSGGSTPSPLGDGPAYSPSFRRYGAIGKSPFDNSHPTPTITPTTPRPEHTFTIEPRPTHTQTPVQPTPQTSATPPTSSPTAPVPVPTVTETVVVQAPRASAPNWSQAPVIKRVTASKFTRWPAWRLLKFKARSSVKVAKYQFRLSKSATGRKGAKLTPIQACTAKMVKQSKCWVKFTPALKAHKWIFVRAVSKYGVTSRWLSKKVL